MLDFPQEGIREFEHRFFILGTLILLFLLIVFFRLGYLQIVRGNFFWVLSSEHTIKEIRIPATRGIFFDRHRHWLAENRPSFDLVIIPQYIKVPQRAKGSLKELANVSEKLFDEKWELSLKLPPFYPIRLKTDISYDEAAQVRVAKATSIKDSDSLDLRGIEVMARPLRRYPSPLIAAPILGYLGEV